VTSAEDQISVEAGETTAAGGYAPRRGECCARACRQSVLAAGGGCPSTAAALVASASGKLSVIRIAGLSAVMIR
jgi:hypothetical protein